MDGEKSHWLVQTTLKSLARLTHRGAVAADGKSGDGCGIMLQFPEPFLREIARECGFKLNDRFASGLVFFTADPALIERGQQILTRRLARSALDVVVWREVPTRPEVVGEQALESMPAIYQVFVNAPAGWQPHDIERQLFAARRQAFEDERNLPDPDPYYYVVTLSNLTMVYKGLVQAEHLGDFYPDLLDERMTSSIGICHQRFSTNTLPRWNYAQPFRYLAHNGEINSVNANRDWANARAGILHSPLLPSLEQLSHLVNGDGSDSSSLDNLLEVFLAGGMDVFRAMRLLLPPAIRDDMDSDLKAFLEFNSMHQEPWDGPAGVVSTNGTIASCNMDRNGLRPARYSITHDGIFTVASETGVWDCPPERIKRRGRLGPGEMIAVDTETGRFWKNNAIDDSLKATHAYREWMTENVLRVWNNDDQERKAASKFMRESSDQVPVFQKMFGLGAEEIETIITPMALEAQEPVGSMGDDTPMAVLSERNRSIYDYFRQSFAQVTNPPIDPLRESAVMSLETCIGREHNVFHETASHAFRVLLPWPVLNYVKYQTLLDLDQRYYRNVRFSLNYEPAAIGLREALEELAQACVSAVQGGATIIVLSDRDIARNRLPIPAPLAVGAVHQALLKASERPNANILIETGSARDSHQYAVLLGLGATAIYPYLAFQTINQQQETGALEGDPIALRKNYRRGIRKGLLKILSKMGICTMASYRGSQLFEAVGLAPEVVKLCCPKVASKIGGAGFAELETDIRIVADLAWTEQTRPMREGIYRYMHGGEQHAYNPDVVMQLQQAVASGDWADYRKFTDLVNHRPTLAIRDLLALKPSEKPLPVSRVEKEDQLFPRFDTAAMSIGALSPEAHQSLAIAMNRLGGRSNSGEGGEDPARFKTERNSRIKQVASGRFGVNAHYLVNADVLQIKVAQGAKPGEGGQLPGHKVTAEIAALRCSTPGVTLISPPPHHDIYSIEDLAELIHDLKNANRHARVSVKLVAEVGVGTIAAGVAKAHADVVLVSGYDGGTGASPQTSIMNAGLPWELGLAETHQTLVLNNLRSRITVETDGQLKTGRDVAVAALLGAEEFGFATAPLVATGCIMMRACHLNTCPVGIATQNPRLREKFKGKPEHVVNFMRFIAEELREIMAELGFRTIDEMIGRVDRLESKQAIEHWKAKGLEFTNLLYSPEVDQDWGRYCQDEQDHGLEKSLDLTVLLELCRPAIERGEEVVAELPIRNVNRVVGTITGSEVTLAHGAKGLPEDTIRLHFRGSAGQSFGAFMPPGMSLALEGDANDYVGKGLSGGKISVFPPRESTFAAEDNIIVGNVALYGATGGEAFIRGMAGERFCVRNSGVNAVVEAVGDHGCEYMTGGRVVVLGPTGRNFAAGMSGGVAYVLDERGEFRSMVNAQMVDLEGVTDPADVAELRRLVERHLQHTASARARQVLDDWDSTLPRFVKVIPRDYKRMLAAIARAEEQGLVGEEAIMAAFEENARDLSRVGGN
jgi:glutamate synthase domain-containing protein 2/glutamate synthase domain-containing protein 3/glutamate synthase domain-containing protein 1